MVHPISNGAGYPRRALNENLSFSICIHRYDKEIPVYSIKEIKDIRYLFNRAIVLPPSFLI